MTAISPLDSIHKKGIFGDHQKKIESNLLKISEVKNLSIIQLVCYKKKKIELKDLKIDDLNLPLESSKVISNEKTRILWNGPNVWLIVSEKENIISIVKKNCKEKDFAVTDISHSRAVIKIKGLEAKEVLKKGCPLDINEIKKNNCAGSIFHGINIIIDCVEENPDSICVFTLRSFAESLYHHITDSALEFGFVCV